MVMGYSGGYKKIIRHFSLVIMVTGLLILPFEKRGSAELVVVILVLIINAVTILATYLLRNK
jgi:hypothetical protein